MTSARPMSTPFQSARPRLPSKPLVHRTRVIGAACLALFMGTALMGLWLAHDQPAARVKFAWMGLGALIAGAITVWPRRGRHSALRLAGMTCAYLAAAIAIVSMWPGYGDARARAGALTVLIPLAACGFADTRWSRPDWQVLSVGLAMAVGIAGVIVSGEAAAAGGLMAGGGAALWARWRFGRGGRRGPATLADGAMIAAAVVAAGLYVFAIVSPGVAAALSRAFGSGIASRVDLWHDSLAMVRDYVFTGCGLASTPMVLSSYLWLAHVPLHPHVHNLFLQIALEQGAPGLVAFLVTVSAAGVSALTTLRQARLKRVATAVLASLAALVVYGAMESDLYDGPFVVCLFLPLGFAWAIASLTAEVSEPVVRPGARWRMALPAALALAGVIASLTLWTVARAQMIANLGALAQTRAELSVYRWPLWKVQDEVRRAGVIDLEPAIARFWSALARESTNVTARRRLGQIALSRGDYRLALEHLEVASAGAPDERPTRQLLGEARAVTGDVEGAARAWAPGTRREDLELRHWWYGHIGADAEARRMREAIDLLGRTRPGS